jgi:hypothetical protein
MGRPRRRREAQPFRRRSPARRAPTVRYRPQVRPSSSRVMTALLVNARSRDAEFGSRVRSFDGRPIPNRPSACALVQGACLWFERSPSPPRGNAALFGVPLSILLHGYRLADRNRADGRHKTKPIGHRAEGPAMRFERRLAGRGEFSDGFALLMICNTDGASWRRPRKPGATRVGRRRDPRWRGVVRLR